MIVTNNNSSAALLFLYAFLLLGAIFSVTTTVSAQLFTEEDDVWDFDDEFDIDDYNVCDFGPDALTNAFGKSIPRTCFDVLDDAGDETIERCYYTYVPDSCHVQNTTAQNKVKAPLVVDVHGLGSCALYSAFYTGWMKIADQEDDCMIVVWPSASNLDRFATPCFNIPGYLRSDNYGSSNGNNVTTVPCCCFGAFDTLDDQDAVDDNTNTNFGMFLFPTKEPDDPLFIKMVIDSVVESFLRNGTDETETETEIASSTSSSNSNSNSNSNSDTSANAFACGL